MKRNAFFQLVQKEDGLYLKSYPAVNGGSSLKNDDIRQYLTKKNYQDVDLMIIKTFLDEAAQKENALVKLLDGAHILENEYAIVSTDKKSNLAKIRLYPPSNN